MNVHMDVDGVCTLPTTVSALSHNGFTLVHTALCTCRFAGDVLEGTI